MATVLLFHHALGQTTGFLAFADELRSAGHTVHTPDLYDGATFDDLDAGVAHAEAIGFEAVIARGTAAAEQLPADVVYAGFSLGVLPAQSLAQTRPGARGALLFHECLPPAELGGSWPDGVPLQVHAMEGDEWTDLEVARRLADERDEVELFVYPGSSHLFAEPAIDDYDEASAKLLMARTLAFLELTT